MSISSSRKQLFFKCVCFAILLVTILSILNIYYLQRNICDNDRTAKFKNIKPGIMISNTGSSHGLYGFNYEELGDEYNWKEDIKQHIFPVINDEEVLKTFVEGKPTGEAFQKIWYLNAAEAEDLEFDAQSAYERHYVNNGNLIATKK